jgi:DNA-binding transcriptional LysR family regulator
MDLRQLRYFVAVAEEGHITRAAERLGMQQPPLSQQIHALEAQLGLALFERHPRGVTLTDAGRALQVEARRLIDSADLLALRMQRMADGQRGLLSVGFTSSAAAHAFTPAVLRACRRESPEVDLQMSESNAAELIEGLSAHRIDVAFLRLPVARPGALVFETLFVEPMMLVLPLDHPLADCYGPEQPVPLEALRDEALILVRRPGAPGMYANLLARLSQRGIPVRVVAEVPRMMSNVNLVAAGAGISIVPASMSGAHARSVVYRPLRKDAGIEAPITVAYRDGANDPVSGRFLALVRRVVAETIPASSRRRAGGGPRRT